jgi:excisionase family DNA binding protein
MNDDRLIDAVQVAERLGVKASWVARAGREGRLPSVRLGKYRRYRWSEIEQWLGEQAKRAA